MKKKPRPNKKLGAKSPTSRSKPRRAAAKSRRRRATAASSRPARAKVFTGSGAVRFVRESGTKVNYSPRESAFYNSLRVRQLRGNRLTPYKVEGNLFYYRSRRSPSGFWVVERNIHSGNSGRNLNIGLPCTPSFSDRKIVQIRFTEDVTQRWTYPDGTIVDRPYSTTGGWIYYFEPGDRFEFQTQTLTGMGTLGMSNGSEVQPAAFTILQERVIAHLSIPGNQLYWLNETQDWTGWNGSLFHFNRVSTLQIDFFELDNTTPITNPCPLDGGGGGQNDRPYSCNCPDYSRKEPSDLSSPFPSRGIGRDWSASDAGSPGPCKHIFATRHYLREAFRTPGIQPGEPIILEWESPPQPLGNWDVMETDPNAVRDWARGRNRSDRARSRAARRVSADNALADQFFSLRRRIGELSRQKTAIFDAAREETTTYNRTTRTETPGTRINPDLLDQGAIARLTPQINAAQDQLERLKERLMTETNQRYTSGAITRDEYETLLNRFELEQ